MSRDLLDFRTATFLKSASKLSQCPPDSGREIAFAGRSNAGKSTALNCITDNKKLARTSKTPGRTQLINYFTLTDTQRLVDLPGYGFAKVPEEVRRQWQKHMDDYLLNRQSLVGIVLLMDIRHPMKQFDRTMIEWAVASEMPIRVLLTKADKLKKGQASKALQGLRKELKDCADLASVQLFSALDGAGLDDIRDWLNLHLALEHHNDAENGEGE